MWQLVLTRSRRKRSGHRHPLLAAPVPIILRRLSAALSTRSGDPSEMQIPGFIMREREDQRCPVSARALFAATAAVASTLSALRTNWKKSVRSIKNGLRHRHLRVFPVTLRSELWEFTAVTCREAPSLSRPRSVVQKVDGRRGKQQGGSAGEHLSNLLSSAAPR